MTDKPQTPDLTITPLEAQRFFQFSERDDTQVFITSHSPAFYLAEVGPDSVHQVGRYFVTKQQGTDPSDISPSHAITSISTLAETEQVMGEAGLLQLPFIIRQVSEHEKEISQLKAEVDAANVTAQDLSSDLQKLKIPTLYVEGKHDKILFDSALLDLGLKGQIEVLPLHGTPSSPYALIKALMKQGGLGANRRALFLFDNDEAGRAACEAICKNPTPSSPVDIENGIAAWVLPLSEEYKVFLKTWNIAEKRSFFPAEFLFPAQETAKLYQEILTGDLSQTRIQGDIWNQIKSDQTRAGKMQNLGSNTVDWFFSRGVDNGNKEYFATKADEKKLSLEEVNKVTRIVVGFLLNV